MAKRRRGGGGQGRQPKRSQAPAESAADDAAPDIDPEDPQLDLSATRADEDTPTDSPEPRDRG